jgi:hypothetical protein
VKALTIKQPWASFIIDGHPDDGIKDVENRLWETSYRGPLLIHAGKKYDTWPGDHRHTDWYKSRPSAAQGAIIGVAELVAVDDYEARQSVWAEWEGAYRWRLAWPRPFPQPIAWRGLQGLWEVDLDDGSHAAATVLEQLAACGWTDRERS